MGFIDLQDDEILTILHAHTRVTHISNFNLPPWFSKFERLREYFSAYLSPLFYGHAVGQLQEMHVSNLYALMFCRARKILRFISEILYPHDPFVRMLVIEAPLLDGLYTGRSSANLDESCPQSFCTRSIVVDKWHTHVLHCHTLCPMTQQEVEYLHAHKQLLR